VSSTVENNGGTKNNLRIDVIDRSIVGMLQEDGRRTFSEIAQSLGVSIGAVRNRVMRLMDAQVFKVVAVADPAKLGNTGYAMLLIKLNSSPDPAKVSQYFADLSEVSYVNFTAGRYDLLVEIICESTPQLHDFLATHCYSRSDIASTEAMLSLKMYKNLLVWGKP
jgi:Lrp/AsnC family transcriptional regulator for asnA, asnC and gidA